MWRLRTQLSYIKKLKELMMDTLLITIAVIAFCAVGYVVLWIVRTVRRIGFRRFAKALGALVWAVLVAIGKLLIPGRSDGVVQTNSTKITSVDALNDVLEAQEVQRLSDENSRIGFDHHF
jgi:hypothetical protein